MVHASSVNDFKNKLDAHWSNQEMVYNYRDVFIATLFSVLLTVSTIVYVHSVYAVCRRCGICLEDLCSSKIQQV